MPVYYALNYSGILNRSLTTAIAIYLSCVALLTWQQLQSSSSMKVANRDLCTPHTCEISCLHSLKHTSHQNSNYPQANWDY